MNVLDQYLKSAHRRLDALHKDAQEEPWKVDYREAEGLHFFELSLANVLEVLKYIREIEKSWRAAVYRGIEKLSEDKDAWIREGFSRWLDLSAEIERSVRHFEQRGYKVAQSEKFREAIEAIRRTLANWVSPLPARSPSMLVEDVEEAEAENLRAIDEAENGSPGKLKVTPVLIPEGDASLLR